MKDKTSKQQEPTYDHNKINFLYKIHNQKVVKVKKLTQTMLGLKKSLLGNGAIAIPVCDNQYQVTQLNVRFQFIQ